MKKICYILLSVVLFLSLTACSQPTLNEKDILAAAQEILDKQAQEQEKDVEKQEDVDAKEEDESDNENSVSGVVDTETKVNTDELAKNITVDVYPLESGEALFKLTNNNSSDICSLNFTINFYDSDQKIIKNYETYFTALGAGREAYALSFDLNKSGVDFKNYKAQIDIEDYDIGYKNAIDSIKVEANVSKDGNVMAEITNTGSDSITSMNALALFYLNDELVGASYESSYDLKAGGFDVLEFWPPIDENFNTIEYDRYSVFINEAYTG